MRTLLPGMGNPIPAAAVPGPPAGGGGARGRTRSTRRTDFPDHRKLTPNP